jgi:hypothetical protein
MSFAPMGDKAWRLDHMSTRDQRAMDEQIGRFAASLSRRARKVGGFAWPTVGSQGSDRPAARTLTVARAERSSAGEAC